jgi:hypothetical protein
VKGEEAKAGGVAGDTSAEEEVFYITAIACMNYSGVTAGMEPEVKKGILQ